MSYNLINIHSHFIHKTGIEIISLDNNELSGENVCFSYGIHPQKAGQIPFKTELLDHACCMALGEAGLDKLITVPLPDQLDCLEMQIRLSEQRELPLILHCVKAWNEVVQIRRKLNPKQYWIFHGFRKTALLESVLKEGLMISVGTAVLHDQKLQEVIPHIPDDRLFLETDSDTTHGIAEVYEKVAELRSISIEKLAEVIESNFRRVFKPSFEPSR